MIGFGAEAKQQRLSSLLSYVSGLLVVGALVLWGVPVARAESSSADSLQGFLVARDRLFTNPDARPEDYRRLVYFWATIIPPDSLSPAERQRAAFEGLYDLPPWRSLAADLLREDARAPTASGAGAAAALLRLSGWAFFNVILNTSPISDQAPRRQLERQELLELLLTHPGLSERMRSAGYAQVLEALSGVPASALRHQGQHIAEAFAFLDASLYPQAAEQMDRFIAILAVALSGPEDTEPRRKAQVRLGQFGAAALATGQLSPGGTRRLKPLLPVLLSGSEEDSGTRRTNIEPAGDRLLLLGGFAVRGGGQSAMLSTSYSPGGEAPLMRMPQIRHLVTVSGRHALVGEGDSAMPAVGRAFGGLYMRNFALQVYIGDTGWDSKRGEGFARGISLFLAPYYLHADSLDDRGKSGEVRELHVGANIGSTRLVEIYSPRLSFDANDRAVLERPAISLLGLRLLTWRTISSTIRLPDTADKSSTAGALPTTPRGASPTKDWLKMPQIGLSEGNLTLKYNNAVKFGKRWTAAVGLQYEAAEGNGYSLGLNYNWRDVNNGADRFLTATQLQDNFLDSYYFIIKRDNVFDENDLLTKNVLFSGVYTASNQFYTHPDGTRGMTDTPFSVLTEGGTALGRYAGMRGQVAYETVSEVGYGEDTRVAFMGILGTRQIRVGRGISVAARTEGIWRTGQGEQYGWLRAYGGLSIKVLDSLRLSTAYVRSIESGTARFPFDSVEADHGIAVRGDVTLGSFRLGYANRYSAVQKRWIRWQSIASFPIGGFEPYISADQRFLSIGIGVRVRLNDFLDRFRPRPAEALVIY